ncbi:MAG: hypothetical protein ACFFC7_05525 [Candidatus Hermodarchaeota archaeon]
MSRHFAFEAQKKVSKREVTAHTLEKTLRDLRGAEDLTILEALVEYIIDDLRIHGFIGRDRRVMHLELEEIFVDLKKYLEQSMKFLIELYAQPYDYTALEHPMSHLFSQVTSKVISTSPIIREFKANMCKLTDSHLHKPAIDFLEISREYVAQLLVQSSEKYELDNLFEELMGENLAAELEAAGFGRTIDESDINEEEYIERALERIHFLINTGYQNLIKLQGSAQKIERLENFYERIRQKSGRDYSNLEPSMKQKLIAKFLESIDENMTNDLVRIIAPDRQLERFNISTKLDRIFQFIEEGENVREQVMKSGIKFDADSEKDFEALRRILNALFQYSLGDLLTPFFLFRNFVEGLLTAQANLASILHRRHGKGKYYTKKNLNVAFREIFINSAVIMGDRPLIVVPFVLGVILKQLMKNMQLSLIDDPSPLHERICGVKKPVLEIVDRITGNEWIFSELAAELYIKSKAPEIEKIEEEILKEEELTPTEIAKKAFSYLSQATNRFLFANKSSSSVQLLGLHPESSLREGFQYMLKEGGSLRLIDQEFIIDQSIDQKPLTITQEFTELVKDSGFENEMRYLLDRLRLHTSARYREQQIATRAAKDTINLLNTILYVNKVRYAIKADLSDLISLLSSFKSAVNNYYRKRDLRTIEFLNELMNYGQRMTDVFPKFEGFEPLLAAIVEPNILSTIKLENEKKNIIHRIRTTGKKMTAFTKLLDSIGGETVLHHQAYLSNPQLDAMTEELISTLEGLINTLQLFMGHKSKGFAS